MAGTAVLLRGLPDLPALQDELTAYFDRRGPVRGVRLLGPGRAIVTFAEDRVPLQPAKAEREVKPVAPAVTSEPELLFFGARVKIEPCPRDLVANNCEHQQGVTESTTAHEASVGEMTSGEVDVGEGMANYLQTYRADDIVGVWRKLSMEEVRIRNTKTGFSISGTAKGISQAREGLEDMAAKVRTAVLTVENADQLRGFHRFIAKEKTAGRLRDIERDQQCVIVADDTCSLSAMEDEDIAALPTPPSSCDENSCELRVGGLILQAVRGDLTTETAAVIVVPISNILDHSRGIARTVSKAAGPSVLDQCREYVKTEGLPRGGDIVAVEGGRLPCGVILYLTSPDAKHLRSDVKNCLCLANNLGGSSVALPAIGTGGFGIAPEKCARRMIRGIVEFAQHAGGKKLTLVKIVVQQNKILEAFRTEMFKRSSAYGATLDRLTDGPPADALLLHFFGPDETSVEEAKMRVQEMVDNYSTHEIIVDPTVLQLSAGERRMLQVYSRRQKVTITIDEDNDGCYHIEGSCDVSAEASVVRRFLADRSENRTARRDILGLRRYQWYYVLPSGECRPFGTDNNDRTEEIYQADQQTAYCITGGELCVVDIHGLTLTVLSSGTTYDIVREDLTSDGVGSVPETWDPQPHDRNTNRPKVCHMVKLNPASPEYSQVRSKFRSSCGSVRILSIERVQSPALWEQFSVKKRNMLSRNSTTPIEKELWHGTNAEACREINLNGFNRRYSGQHGTAYGKGTYFAVNASYSAHDRYSSPDTQGRKKMYLAKVLTGECTRGTRNMPVPPRRQDSSGLLYDSTVDATNKPTTFVVFHDAQAYPQYLITFTK